MLLFVVIYSYFKTLWGVNGENITFLCSVMDCGKGHNLSIALTIARIAGHFTNIGAIDAMNILEDQFAAVTLAPADSKQN